MTRRAEGAATPPPIGDGRTLREACVDEALAIIAQEGLEGLSLREVARRLHVSHQAPYKHFANRDEIVGEAIGRAFQDFAAHLASRSHHDDPLRDLAALGAAYLGFALAHPAHYRLLYATPWPESLSPEILACAEAPFAILRDVIARLTGTTDPARLEADALFAWSAVHGLASLLQTRTAERLGFAQADLADMAGDHLRRIAAGLLGARPEGAGPTLSV